MSVSYSFDGRVLRINCIGKYTNDELREAFDAALRDPAFPPTPVFLLDVTLSESLANRPSEDIRETAYFGGLRADVFGRQCAIVAPEDLYYGLMRMASLYAEEFGVDTAVFRTEEEALQWLGA